MKNFLFFLFFVSLSITAHADHIDATKVPAPVGEYVKKNYNQATHITWEYEHKKDYYEAEFEVAGLEHELKISPSGALLYSKIDILLKSIPSSIQHYLKTNYTNFNILEASKMTNGGSLKYKISMAGENSNGHKKNKSIYFDADGNVIKKK